MEREEVRIHQVEGEIKDSGGGNIYSDGRGRKDTGGGGRK